METSKAIKERVSCRDFNTEEIPIEYVNLILEAARQAPSPKNRQPWKFLVLQNEKKEEFEKLISIPQDSEDYISPAAKKLNEWDSWKKSYECIKKSNMVVLVFNHYPSDLVLGKENILFDITNFQAIGAAIQNMLLTATDLGISSLWICDIFSHYQIICDRYYPNGQLVAAVAFGYTTKKPIKSTRKPLEQLLIKEV